MPRLGSVCLMRRGRGSLRASAFISLQPHAPAHHQPQPQPTHRLTPRGLALILTRTHRGRRYQDERMGVAGDARERGGVRGVVAAVRVWSTRDHGPSQRLQ